ncbi:hypothetical protein EV187_1194 [Agromyces ramosus]|uniref:Uncharacterized protein n=1 Tax=Agromyces ramosus TaxID=33879 RepID=A0A4Q7MKF3_9MICO|nr:hypothetical protein [Agromyces ramosus]RZS68756.1 hypothetical protein EV187_1194 [Agromyces ramosus]
MSQTTDRAGIDPRFDPRFQRGYVPDAAEAPEPDDETPVSASAGAPAAMAPGRVEPDASAAASASARASVLVPTPAPAPPRSSADLPATSAREPVATSSRVAPDDRGATPFPRAVTDEPAVDDQLSAMFEETDDEPSPTDPWFLAAWAVATVAVVVGGALWWAGIMAEDPFGGARPSDRWLQYVGWVVAPALVQGGLVGIVAMLVWTGVRWARRHREPS